ncbi:hypothetical protein NOLU111490_13805 [Novosphingobium lubricantis]|jgi:hypothetical protein
MSRIMAILAPLAVVQMALPAPAQGRTMMVAACGGAGGTVPLRIPGKGDDGQNLPCCKVCHIAMRKRSGAFSNGGGDGCCGEEDEPDVG